MIDSLQPLSTSIIATVRRDTTSAGQNSQLNRSTSDKTDNVFRLQPQAPEAETQQADFTVASDATIQAQAQAANTNSTNAKLPNTALGYANAAYRLASNFTAFPPFSALNFAV